MSLYVLERILIHKVWFYSIILSNFTLSKITYLKLSIFRVNADIESEIFKQLYGSIVSKKGRILPDYDDVRYNGSLMLGNSHILTGDNIALPQNYKHVGGYHIKNTVEPLSQVCLYLKCKYLSWLFLDK